jgi:mono/diheme cytochrome c family protein
MYQLIAQGRPEQGMPAFASELSNAEINSLVAFIRAWEATAPEMEIEKETLYARYCAFCHGANGEGAPNVPIVLNSPDFLATHDDDHLRQVIAQGHENMPPWGEEHGGVMTAEQIDELVNLIRAWEELGETTPETVSAPGFAADVLPLFEEHCVACHSATQPLGGWDGSSYTSIIESGDHAPVIIPGDPEGSLLVQKLLGTQTVGSQMPIPELLPQEQVQVIIEWIRAGAEDN